MMADVLSRFGWDYAESEDSSGDKFVYWEGEGEPPKWASWVTSCECIEAVYKSFLEALSGEGK